MGGDPIKVQLQMLALIPWIQPEVSSIPSHGHVFLRNVCRLIERLFDRPVMRKVDQVPKRIIEIWRGRPPGDASLGVVVRFLMPGNHRERNVALVEQPSAIQGESFAPGGGGRWRLGGGGVLRQ